MLGPNVIRELNCFLYSLQTKTCEEPFWRIVQGYRVGEGITLLQIDKWGLIWRLCDSHVGEQKVQGFEGLMYWKFLMFLTHFCSVPSICCNFFKIL